MKKMIWKVCNGEAHGNPYIDHCMVCMPWWGSYPICPYCGKAGYRARTGRMRMKCALCKRFAEVTDDRGR